MKKAIVVLLLGMALLSPLMVAKAQDYNVNLKQGFLFTWEGQQLKNSTSLEIAHTKPIEGLGKWNALWDGWLLDVSWVYDADTLDSCALLIGRDFGTLGNYIPIDFPLKDKISLTVYPIGLYAERVFDHPEIQGCSGGAILKLGLKF